MDQSNSPSRRSQSKHQRLTLCRLPGRMIEPAQPSRYFNSYRPHHRFSLRDGVYLHKLLTIQGIGCNSAAGCYSTWTT